MYIKKLLFALIIFSLNLTFVPLTTFAEFDMEHNCIEDAELRVNIWYVGPCKNNKATCIKNLIRYESATEFEKFLKKLEETVEDEKEESFWLLLLEKLGIGAGLGASIYFSPLKSVLYAMGILTLGNAACEVNDNVIEPTGKFLGFFTKGFIKLKNWILRQKELEKPDKGMFGNAAETLFGDKSKENQNKGLLEYIREFIFGDRIVTVLTKEKKKAFVNGIRKELCQQVKDKKWINNKMLLLSIDIDPKVMQFGLKFDNVSFPLKYKEPLKNYFKKIKN